MRYAAALTIVTLVSSASAAKPDKKACFKLAEDGQDLRTSGKLKDARAKFLECARDPCPDVVKNDCTKWVAEVDGELPSIVVRVSKGASDVAIVRVTIDGVEPSGYVAGQPIVLDPGVHKLVVEPKGEAAIEQSVTIVVGEKNRAITLQVPEPIKEDKPPEPPPPQVEPAASAPAWPWIAAGVGVVGLAGFGYFALSGNSAVSKLEDRRCEPNCPDGDVEAAKRKFLIADISLGVSIVSFAIATYGFVSTSKPKTTASVSLGPSGGFAVVTGSF